MPWKNLNMYGKFSEGFAIAAWIQLALNHLESYLLIFYRIFNLFLPKDLGHSTANILIWSGMYHLIIHTKDSDF